MKVLEGNYTGKGIKVGIVAARFNEFITSKLVSGAEDCLVRHEVASDDIEVAWVPVHLRFHWLHRRWQRVESMMR